MKRIMIMGASSGIGLRVAEEFAKRGVMVGLAARHTEPLRELQKKYPDTVVCSRIDVNTKSAPDEMLKLVDKMGGMDIYFHVAGIGFDNPQLDPQLEAEVITTNTAGFTRMISSAYRYFRDNGIKGRIAAITSVAGTKGTGRLAAYSASKAGASTYLVAMEQLANTEKADVKFTDIRPGWIRTPLIDDETGYPMEMDLDYAAPLIIKAIVRHPRVAYIDWRWGLMASMWRQVPDAVWVRLNADSMTTNKPRKR